MQEQRKFKRFPVDLQASCLSRDTEGPEECRVIELSSEGLRLLMRQKPVFGQDVSVDITLPTHSRHIQAVVLFRWAKQIYTNARYAFISGGEVVKTGGDDRHELLDYATHSS